MKRLIPAMLVATLLLYGCPKGSAYHDAVIVEHQAKSVVQAFQQAEIIEFNAGRIGADEHRAIEAQVEKLAIAGQALTTALQSSATQTTVLGDLQVLTQAVGDLGNTGVLGIKNEQSKAALTAAVNAIKAVLQNLQVILSAPTTETTGGKP